MALSLASASVQAMGAALATDLGSGAVIEIRSGAKPASVASAATGTLLATVAIVGSFTSSGGQLTAADPVAAAVSTSGAAGHFRVKTSGGTAKIDGTVSATGGGGDLVLDDVNLVSGGTVNLGVPTFNVPLA